jgi:NADH dehydrogenase FAD-containing subunit
LKKLRVHVELNKKVEEETADSLIVSGKPIKSHTVIWTSGVANNPFFTSHGDVFSLQKNGRVEVDKYLEALPNVYVVGDSNNVAFSGMAWPAMKQATFVAKHLTRLASKRPTFAYRPHAVLSGLPVGHNWGYVEKYGIYVAGRPGYTVRRWMELYGYHQLMPFSMARAIWHAHDISEVHEDSL